MDIKATPQHNRFRRIILPLIAALVIVAAFGLVGAYTANQRSTAPDPFAPYDPASYGIPDTLAGYKVLAIKTTENTACMMPDTMLLLLQSDKENVDTFLESSKPQNVLEALEKLGVKVALELEYLGPDTWDKKQFISNNDEWNRIMKSGGCTLIGGPAVAITPPPQ